MVTFYVISGIVAVITTFFVVGYTQHTKSLNKPRPKRRVPPPVKRETPPPPSIPKPSLSRQQYQAVQRQRTRLEEDTKVIEYQAKLQALETARIEATKLQALNEIKQADLSVVEKIHEAQRQLIAVDRERANVELLMNQAINEKERQGLEARSLELDRYSNDLKVMEGKLLNEAGRLQNQQQTIENLNTIQDLKKFENELLNGQNLLEIDKQFLNLQGESLGLQAERNSIENQRDKLENEKTLFEITKQRFQLNKEASKIEQAKQLLAMRIEREMHAMNMKKHEFGLMKYFWSQFHTLDKEKIKMEVAKSDIEKEKMTNYVDRIMNSLEREKEQIERREWESAIKVRESDLKVNENTLRITQNNIDYWTNVVQKRSGYKDVNTFLERWLEMDERARGHGYEEGSMSFMKDMLGYYYETIVERTDYKGRIRKEKVQVSADSKLEKMNSEAVELRHKTYVAQAQYADLKQKLWEASEDARERGIELAPLKEADEKFNLYGYSSHYS